MSTTRSWRQRVLEADPDFLRLSLRPVVYEFSNGRKFLQPADPYADPAYVFVLDQSLMDGTDVLADEFSTQRRDQHPPDPGVQFVLDQSKMDDTDVLG